MCYFIVFMSLLLFYNVENSKNLLKNPGMRRGVQTFDWYSKYIMFFSQRKGEREKEREREREKERERDKPPY